MRWWLHDADVIVEIATDRQAPEGEARRLSERELEGVIGRVGADLWAMSTLRRIYVDAFSMGGSASISDLVIIGELIDAAHGGRLVAWASEPVRVRAEVQAQPHEAAALADLVDLARPAAPIEPEVVPTSAAILHQVEILQRASASGAPFCEECECGEPA